MKIKGIKKASGATCKWSGGPYYQIVYDRATNEVLALFHWSRDEYTKHPDYLDVVNTDKHMTMAEIREATEKAIEDYNRYLNLAKGFGWDC